jgi:P4 family phage/plasmid primase-like protien
MYATYKDVSCIDIAEALGIENGGSANSFRCFNESAHKNSDNHPSLVIYPERWKCLACGIGDNDGFYSDNVELVKQNLQISSEEAIEWIEKEFLNNGKNYHLSKPKLNMNNGNNNLRQLRFINTDKEHRFEFRDESELDLKDPHFDDKCQIYFLLHKRYSLETLKKAGIKINHAKLKGRNGKKYNGYAIVFPRSPNGKKGHLIHNPAKHYKIIYTEGGTDWLTAIQMGLDAKYGIISIFNKTSRIEIQGEENLFILDSDVSINDIKDQGKVVKGLKSRIMIKKECKAKFIHLPKNFNDLSDYFNSKEYSFSEFLKILDESPFEIIETGNETQKATPTTFNCTEIGNAERFVKEYFDIVRFNYTSGVFLIWNGSKWAEDRKEKFIELGIATIRNILKEALTEENPYIRNNLLKWAITSEKARQIKDMLYLAKPKLGMAQNEFDAQPHLLNLLNGTYDLENDNFCTHNKKDFLSKVAPVHYDPEATCPLWVDFLNQIFENNQELISFVQQGIGYTLTSNTDEQCFFFAYGTGQNGKSTFFETITSLFGDYYLKASQELLTSTNQNLIQQVHDLAELPGKRFVVASELEEGKKLAESRIKDLTGKDTVQARFLYQRPFWFKPICKIWMYGNHKPIVRGTDKGIWRRFYLIPFNVTIPDSEVDKMLDMKLLNEMPGILNWALEGCRLWRKNGLIPPKIVQDSIKEYQGELDIVGRFIDESCIIEPNANVKQKLLYTAYKGWCEDYGEYVLTSRKFSNSMKEKGFHNKPSSGNYYKWIGITLKYEDYNDS